MKPAVIVAGMEPLGLAIVERLLAAGAEVRGIAAPADAPVAARELERLGASVVTGSPRSVAVLEAAGLASASTLVLAADNDAENVDAALLARRLRPGLPLVVRLFNPDLTGYLGDTLPGVTVLSVSRLGAPVFAELAFRALEERAPARRRAGARRRWAATALHRPHRRPRLPGTRRHRHGLGPLLLARARSLVSCTPSTSS